MQIIIIGAGLVGLSLSEKLCEDNDVTLIEKDEDASKKAEELDIKVIKGNGANINVLKDAGVDRADFVISVTEGDEMNIISSTTAKTCGAKKTIARVRSTEYISSPLEKRQELGIDLLINPELLLAYKIVQILFIPSSENFTLFSSGNIGFFEIRLSKEDLFVGKAIKDCDFPDFTLATAVIRGENIFVPTGKDVLLEGDKIILVGKEESIFEIRKFVGANGLKDVLIAGGGTVGLYLAKYLEENDVNVKLIEKDKRRCDLLASELNNVLILNGDGTDVDLLMRENASECDAAISVTDSDETNLISSLLLKQMGCKKTIARVNKDAYLSLYKTLGIDFEVSPKVETFRVILPRLTSNFNSVNTIEDKVKIIEFTAEEKMPITRGPLGDIGLPRGAIVGAIIRDGEVIIPKGDDRIKAGDDVVIFMGEEELKRVRRLLE